MKRTALHRFWFYCLLLFGAGFLAASSAAEPSDDFRQAFLENISLEVTTLGRSHVGTVTRSPVQSVKFEAFPNHGYSPRYATIEVFEGTNGLVPVEIPSTNQELPWFDELIHPDFRLSEDSADAFLDMLQSIMPDDFFNEFDGKRIQRVSSTEWYFLTGEFFDHLKGFVVAVNDTGEITSVSYSLEL